MRFEGLLGERMRKNIDAWIKPCIQANPGMLEAFFMRERDCVDIFDKISWYGEFAGKYLQSAILAYRMTGDEEVKALCQTVAHALSESQSPEGYLGVWCEDARLVGPWDEKTGQRQQTWDTWSHYHCMLGLLQWHDLTGDSRALAVCRKAADYLLSRLPLPEGSVKDFACPEMNKPVSHVLALLYERTGEKRYLDLAMQIVREWERGGDYLRLALKGVPYYKSPNPRWESLHCVQTLLPLYRITGDEQYRRALLQIAGSIVRTDRHNTGGFSSGEQAKGSPYLDEAIETCCTVAWSVLLADALALTEDSRWADELEWSLFNGLMGAQSPSGRWWTYNTPMSGAKLASAHSIVFQARRGSPELNCCSVNGPRGLGLAADWAVSSNPGGVNLWYYGPSELDAGTPEGRKLSIVQETRYPLNGEIRITLRLDGEERFPLKLRIPRWSEKTRVVFEGREWLPEAGTILELKRLWRDGDAVQLSLDMSPHVWIGREGMQGRISLYRGPLLLAYDRAFNAAPPDGFGKLVSLELVPEASLPFCVIPPLCAFRARAERGEILLTDFITAGMNGMQYQTFLPFDAVLASGARQAMADDTSPGGGL